MQYVSDYSPMGLSHTSDGITISGRALIDINPVKNLEMNP